MARTVNRSAAISEGVTEWLEELAEYQVYLDQTCNCCCCTGECTYNYSELEEIEQKVFYGELDAWPF
jgi:hypothetical protein